MSVNLNKIQLLKVELGKETLARIAFSPKSSERQPHWWDVANILTEKGGFFLTEQGGALTLEQEVKVMGVKPQAPLI